MRYLLDTNILLYAVNRDAEEQKIAMDILQQAILGIEPWCLTWVNIYEFLRVSTHPRIFPSPLSSSVALSNIRNLLKSPGLSILTETSRHNRIVEEVYQDMKGVQGNLWHDCHIATLMLEHDVRVIITGDADFRKFTFLRVENPF